MEFNVNEDLILRVNTLCKKYGFKEVNRNALATLPLTIVEEIMSNRYAPLIIYSTCSDMTRAPYQNLFNFDTPENLSKYFYLIHLYKRPLTKSALVINIETMLISMTHMTRFSEKTITIEEYLKYKETAEYLKYKETVKHDYDYWCKIFDSL